MLEVQRTNSAPRWQRLFLYLTLSGLAVTGSAWMIIHYATGGFSGEHRPYAMLHQLMIYHGILGYVMAIATGIFLGQHVAAGWRAGRSRATGVSVMILLGVLMSTALVLYYSGNDDLRSLASLVHQILGVGVVLAIPLHVAQRIARPTHAVRVMAADSARETNSSAV